MPRPEVTPSPWLKPVMSSPSIVLSAAPAASSRPLAPEPAEVPSIWMSGVPVYPGWLIPLIVTGVVMIGSGVRG